MDPGFHLWGAEVQEESDGEVGHSEVGEELFLVDLSDFFDGFEFDDDSVFDDDIGSEAFLEGDVSVFDGDGDFSLDVEAVVLEFVAEYD